MKKNVSLLLLGTLFFLTSVLTSDASYRVFFLDSYHEDYEWSQKVLQGIKEGLTGTQTDLNVFYMDTKQHPDEAHKNVMGQKARAAIDKYKPDLLITSSDDAQHYVGRHYAGKNMPLVFCSVLANPKNYGYPASNVTGLLLRTYHKESLKLLGKHLPSVKRVVSVGDDSPTNLGGLSWMRKDLAQAGGDIRVKVIKYQQVGTFAEWKKTVAHYQDKTDALLFGMYHTLRDDSGNTADPEKVMRWTVSNSSLPEVGLTEWVMRHGGLMGVVVSGYQHGYQAGKMATEILTKKKRPSDIPLRAPEKGKIVVNSARFRNLGIPIPRTLTRGVKIYRK